MVYPWEIFDADELYNIIIGQIEDESIVTEATLQETILHDLEVLGVDTDIAGDALTSTLNVLLATEDWNSDTATALQSNMILPITITKAITSTGFHLGMLPPMEYQGMCNRLLLSLLSYLLDYSLLN